MEQLEERSVPAAIVLTDKPDYAPESLAIFTATSDGGPDHNFQVGETVRFQVTRTDGVQDYPPANLPWQVTDGVWSLDNGATEFTPYQDGNGIWWYPDTDRTVDGNFGTTWYVDGQYAGASLLLTATGLSSGEVATAEFTDGNVKAKISSPNIGDTFDLFVEEFRGSKNNPNTDCSGTPDETSTHNNIQDFQANGIQLVDSIRLTASTTSDLGGAFEGWYRDDGDNVFDAGDTLITASTVVCEPGFQGEGTHLLFAKYGAATNADLSISKSDSPDPVNEGSQLTYTLTVSNAGPAAAQGVMVNDTLPAGLTGATYSVNGVPMGAWTGSVSLGTLAASASATITITATVPNRATASTLTNTATVTSTTTDPNTSNNSSTSVTTVADVAPSIAISKSHTGTINEGTAGQTLTYSFTVSNTSTATTDPVTVTYLNDTVLGDLLGAFTTANGSATLAYGASRTFTVTYNVPVANAGATIANTVTVKAHDDDTSTETSATASDSVTYQDVAPSIAISKSHTGTINEGTAGQTLTYSFTVSNTSTATTDPVTVTYLNDTVLGDLLGAFTTANGSATLAYGASRTFTVTYNVPVANAGATIANTVTVKAHDDETPEGAIPSADEIGSSASDTETYQNVTPSIAVSKTVDADEDGNFNDSESVFEDGVGDQKVDYKFVITNISSASTDPVTITSISDDKLSAVYGDLIDEAVTANGGNPIVLAPGGSFTFYVNDWTVPPQTAGTTYVNTVRVNGKDDENTAAPEAQDTGTVLFADLAPGKITGGGSVDERVRNFGFIVQPKLVSGTTISTGNLEFQDKNKGYNLKSTAITNISVSPDRTLGSFRGSGSLKTPTGTLDVKFLVVVEDQGEPGGSTAGGADKFRIRMWYSNQDPTVATPFYDSQNYATKGGLLDKGGNIQIHKAASNLTAFGTQTASSEDDSPLIYAAGQIMTGIIEVAIVSDAGEVDPAQLMRIQDAMLVLNETFGSYGLILTFGNREASGADIHIYVTSTSPYGGVSEGILGYATTSGDIILVRGWDWYVGADPQAIGSDQYDFQTIATHELGHSIGLGHSGAGGSVMYPYLGTGAVRRTLADSDLALLHASEQDEGGIAALRAWLPRGAPNDAAPAVSGTPASSALNFLPALAVDALGAWWARRGANAGLIGPEPLRPEAYIRALGDCVFPLPTDIVRAIASTGSQAGRTSGPSVQPFDALVAECSEVWTLPIVEESTGRPGTAKALVGSVPLNARPVTAPGQLTGHFLGTQQEDKLTAYPVTAPPQECPKHDHSCGGVSVWRTLAGLVTTILGFGSLTSWERKPRTSVE